MKPITMSEEQAIYDKNLSLANPYAYSVRHFSLALQRAWAEIIALQEIIETNNICHNLHGKVDARAFADGCAAEQIKLYGIAPDVQAGDKLAKTIEGALHEYLIDTTKEK